MRITRLIAAAALAVAFAPTLAQPVTPTFGSFGSLPQATFNGSGIPNDAVAITTITTLPSGSLLNPITLGLTATQRFNNPALTNDGAGTFYAAAGGDTVNAQPGLARWNFNYFLSGDTRNVGVKLFYDFDPAAANAQSTHGVITFGTTPLNNSNNLLQDSSNLGFAAFAATVPLTAFGGQTTPSPVTSFSSIALGEYTFALVVFDTIGTELGRSAIRVVAVPEPATVASTLLGLAAVVAFTARRRRGGRGRAQRIAA
jgi:hypothetical protein